MALKLRANSPGVKNVVLGGTATLDLDPGYRYHKVNLIVTVTKTGATAGNAFQPLLSDALGLIDIKVDTKSRRQHLATELNAIQTRWSANLAVAQLDQVANDCITAVADVVNGANTTRCTTFILPICFAEPFRDSYTAREAFAWPTKWASGRTCKIQIALSIPANAGVANPVARATHSYDNVLGPVINGADSMPITHWYRDTETYSGTAVPIETWPFQSGSLQQINIFSPAGDDVATYEVKGDGAVLSEGTKTDSENDNNNYGWNPAATNPDRFDLAADYDDDPMGSFIPANFGTFRLNLTLTQAAAANKNLIMLEQVYQDAFGKS
jgi:hypothetical protein